MLRKLYFSIEREMENEEAMENETTGIPTYDGKYVQYNILGNLFEVSGNYVPPIQPVGRGAYGIVWYFLLLLPFLPSY